MTTTVTQTVGGGTLTVTPKVKPYNEIQNFNTFAVIKSDGSVVYWGYGITNNSVPSQLDGTNDVVQIFTSSGAFAALRQDDSVVTWTGNSVNYGNFPMVASLLNGDVDVKQISSTASAFAALRQDGTVVVWGADVVYYYINNSLQSKAVPFDNQAISNKLGTGKVVKIFTSQEAFAALKEDGSVVTWGTEDRGGNSSAVANQLVHVKEIFSSGFAFAALKADGSVVTWGLAAGGGDSSAVASQINGNIDVVQIYSNGTAFAALRVDGTVVTWGNDGSTGGNSSAVAQQLIHVSNLQNG